MGKQDFVLGRKGRILERKKFSQKKKLCEEENSKSISN